METIGDAYMCVSGLPERIGKSHVTEICNMALTILNTVRTFEIRHIPNEGMRIRIGINSGKSCIYNVTAYITRELNTHVF